LLVPWPPPHRLLQLLDGIAAKVNLIEFNPHEGTPFQPSTEDDVIAFRNILAQVRPRPCCSYLTQHAQAMLQPGQSCRWDRALTRTGDHLVTHQTAQ
jgi:hypothetical protein